MDKGKNKAGMSEGGSSGGSGINTDCQKSNKLRILLYDADVESSQQCSSLLRQCSSNYQVKAVFSANEVMNALNSSCTTPGFEIDIILAEASLLVSTGGSHLLRYITQSNDLKHIPVIMMFEEDDVSMIFKGLGFGATDYIMKPLGVTDVLNLWDRIHKRKTSHYISMRMRPITCQNI
ncbi:hypothetical protein DCAR_0624734 [Daucus carota subsp. sativus]|uniref:Response regulatory domain-containing protein n=1 Tax=Daucus carota subsp. sativus TaxID=79200 RepID=A0AAF1B5E9_DAUCS|nr:hypothetical protein DCAR_0624734 [Daucus carota subsp. sativus]